MSFSKASERGICTAWGTKSGIMCANVGIRSSGLDPDGGAGNPERVIDGGYSGGARD